MPEPNQHIALICNPTAQNSKALHMAAAIAGLLKGQNIAYSLFTTYWPQMWNGITQAWIIGGDGTVNHFINQNPYLKLPMAVFAGGTANDLHFQLYGSIGLEEQVMRVLQAEPQFVDVGQCKGRLFLNGVGIGFDGAIVRQLLGKKKRPGKASYLLTILNHIFRYKETFAELKWKEGQLAQDCFMISVANGRRFGGGFTVAPKAVVQDGLLDLMVVGAIAAHRRIRYLPLIERGEHLALPFVQYHQTGCVVIQSAMELPAHRDGEYFSAKRFEIRCLPHHFSFLL